MKANVDQNKCISCGMCIDICPEVFKYNDDNISTAITDLIPKECESSVKEAFEACPVEAITITEN